MHLLSNGVQSNSHYDPLLYYTMEPPEQPAAFYIGNNNFRGGNLTGIKHHPGNSYYTKLIKAAAAAIARLTGDGVSHEPPTATSAQPEFDPPPNWCSFNVTK